MKNILGNRIIRSGYVSPIDTTNLFSYYRFDSNSNDYSGSNDGIDTGVSYISGVLNNCVDFAGVDTSNIVLPGADFTFGNGVTDNPFSISMWVYFDVIQNSFIINKRSGTNVSEYQFLYLSGKLEIWLFSNSSASIYIKRAVNIQPTVSTWNYYTITYDGSGLASGINIYTNGSLNNGVTTTSGTYVAMDNTGIDLELGIAKITSLPFDGKINALGWWNEELTATKVSDLYNEQLTNDLK